MSMLAEGSQWVLQRPTSTTLPLRLAMEMPLFLSS